MGVNAHDIIKRVEKLQAERRNWDNQWQEAAEYCRPTKTNITVIKVSGEKVSTENYDATARNAVQVASAAIHSYMTNPASKWFGLRTKQKDLMDDKEVKMWFKAVEDTIYNVLNTSNFAQEVHEAYLDLFVFGTFCLYEEEDPKEFVRFYCRPLKEMLIAEGFDGRVDTAYRMIKMTARQAKQRWPESCGSVVEEALTAKQPDKEVDFIHCVTPREERDVKSKESKDMPFASVYLEKSKQHICEEGGYIQFPYFITRFSKLAGDVWGYSPAMISMPDIKMLNAVTKTMIRSAQKIVDPPMQVPNNAYLLPLNTNPGGINFRIQRTADAEIKPIATGGNIPVGMDMVKDLRAAIQKAFFVDVFLMLNQQEGGVKTATEVNALVAEKMLIVGPVLGRLMSEFLNPLINRTFALLAERKALPQVPEQLLDVEYVVDYISPLAKAQKYQEINSIQQLMALVGNMAQVFPSVLDKIDSDKTIDDAADIYGVNPELVRDGDEVSQMREERAEEEQAQKEMMMAQQVAETAKTGTEAMKNLEPEQKGVK